MTEELKQKAKDYANKWLWFVKGLEMERKTDPKPEYIRIEEAYIAGATEVTKELQEELVKKSDTNHTLVEQMADLEIKNQELEAQIEKMKCCDNCNYFVSKKEGWVCEKGSIYQFCIGKTCTDWQLKE